jgi:hypothetical protein
MVDDLGDQTFVIPRRCLLTMFDVLLDLDK